MVLVIAVAVVSDPVEGRDQIKLTGGGFLGLSYRL